MCIYVYTHTHTHTHPYIHIYSVPYKYLHFPQDLFLYHMFPCLGIVFPFPDELAFMDMLLKN